MRTALHLEAADSDLLRGTIRHHDEQIAHLIETAADRRPDRTIHLRARGGLRTRFTTRRDGLTDGYAAAAPLSITVPAMNPSATPTIIRP